jgi:hypothetical protein
MSEIIGPETAQPAYIDQVPSLLNILGVNTAELNLPADPNLLAAATTQSVGDNDDY